jgi:hypothetical protein
MKLKNFFNSQRKNAVVRELKNDFMPVLEKVTTPVITFAKKNPQRTFTLMIITVIINIIILFLFTDAFVTKKSAGIPDIKFQSLQYGINSGTAPDIRVSFENIKEVRVIRDSLAWLMSLKHMTFQDTLTFVRVMDEFQKISSGKSGIPLLKLEDLRNATQFDKPNQVQQFNNIKLNFSK